MDGDAAIRPYRPGDRGAVRRVACETADAGRPVERFFGDRELAADLLTRYYTDWEPGSLAVAEHGERVVGYLAGCLDTRRCRRVVARRLAPRIAARAACRGIFWSRDAWRLAGAALGAWRRGRRGERVSLEAYPAHLHVNLLEGSRGQGLGRALVERFLAEHPAYALRFRLRPGITGLAQIHGHYDSSVPSKLRYDLVYLSNISLVLDAKILFRTIQVVLMGKKLL